MCPRDVRDAVIGAVCSVKVMVCVRACDDAVSVCDDAVSVCEDAVSVCQ